MAVTVYGRDQALTSPDGKALPRVLFESARLRYVAPMPPLIGVASPSGDLCHALITS
jgi:hypothetical protein